MTLQIQRGLVKRPQRVVIYAPEGLGKSTLASQLASPLFLDFEKGTHHLDVARLEPSTLTDVDAVLAALAKDSQGFQTLVVDTIDWLEELVIQDVCRVHKKAGIEDFGYGKGYTVLCERFNGLLLALDRVAAKMDVLCLAHSHVKRLELPETPPFDHYELKLSKQVAPLVREWCDALLFGNWKTIIKQGDDDRTKATSGSGKERRLFTSHSTIADAKNRHGLREEEPWSLDTLKRCLAPANAAQGEPARAGAVAAHETKPVPKEPVPVHTSQPGPAAPVKAVSVDEIPGNEPLDPVLVATCQPHEEAVNDFLRARDQIHKGQTWRDVRPDYAARIVSNPARFLRFVNPQPQEVGV
jgi:hypothetical protein